MKVASTVSALMLVATLSAGMLSAPAFANLPANPANVQVMDTNKNGKIEKDEYLAFLGARFDQAAGSKGYCTFEEVAQGANWWSDQLRGQNN